MSQEDLLAPAAATAREIIAGAIRGGIRNFVACPGSRCAPLTIALAQAEAAGIIDLHIETDERVAGFVALGMGKAGKPAAVVTTSGSAVANLHPAVEEAFYSAVPLFVISADRPHTLRGVRASQTTDQSQVLRGSVRDLIELPAELTDLPAVRNHLRRAVRRCLGIGFSGADGPGPVQLNVAFAPPLHTEQPWNLAEFTAQTGEQVGAQTGEFSVCTENSRESLRSVDRYSQREAFVARAGCFAMQKPINRELAGVPKRTVIVAGPSSLGNTAEFAAETSALIGQIPVLAEPGSALRRLPQAVSAHPELLRSKLGTAIERAIVIGHPTLTREVSQLLANPQVEVIVVDEAPSFTDISGNAVEIINFADIGAYATADLQWYQLWERASLQARRQIHRFLHRGESLPTSQKLGQSEIAVALAASRVTTFYAASSIIREVNLYGSCEQQDVFANRGLAGIDGNISTAVGIADARREPVRVAVGDIAFIHDLGALVRTVDENRELDLQVVLLDDGGGSLFATLEYGAGDVAIFDRVFRTEKEFNFRDYAKALGERVKFTEFTGDFAKLADLLAQPPRGVEIVYLDLRGSSMQEIREQRNWLREQISADLHLLDASVAELLAGE